MTCEDSDQKKVKKRYREDLDSRQRRTPILTVSDNVKDSSPSYTKCRDTLGLKETEEDERTRGEGFGEDEGRGRVVSGGRGETMSDRKTRPRTPQSFRSPDPPGSCLIFDEFRVLPSP